MMRLHLTQGQHLAIMDMDVDAHQMMQFSGPAHLRMGGPMMMSHGLTIPPLQYLDRPYIVYHRRHPLPGRAGAPS